MVKWIIALGIVLILLGAAIIGYGVYNAMRPPTICEQNGTGCGAAQGIAR